MMHLRKSLLFLPVSLGLVGATICFRAPSAPVTADVTVLAGEFVDRLAKADFAGAAARYDETMRVDLPEPKLRETWQTLVKQAGPFKKQLQKRVSKAGEYDIVLVTSEFERAKLDIKVVFNGKREVSGLFFLPSTAAAESAGLPSYVRTNAFRERPFTVGSGEWALPGTLSIPITRANQLSPAVVLVHGSGPNDRDETVGGAKPFRDLAWGLASRGIAVLRYEKRTREHGAKLVAKGIHITAREETIDDALSAANQLRHTDGIEPRRIFLLGHSFGGTIAPRIGQGDTNLAGLIIMAGATRPIEDLIIEQTRYMLSLKSTTTPEEREKLRDIESKVASIKKLTAADASSSTSILGAPPSYWLDRRTDDPVANAKTLTQPLLILQGGRDYQVTQVDFDGWKKGLSGSSNVTFKLYPDLNHPFIAGKGPSSPAEYESPGHVSETVVSDIRRWILEGPDGGGLNNKATK